MTNTLVTDFDIDKRPLVSRFESDNGIMTNYNILQSDRSNRSRKRRRAAEKRSGKTTRANKTLVYKNNSIEKKPRPKFKKIEYRKVKY